MRYEWDADKRRANLDKHGLDFADVERGFDWELALLDEDDARAEQRDQAIGYLFQQVVVLVYTLRGDACRIISLRRADPRERRAYERS
ncbi:BrnT family toxin [Psychromarinibacter sp. C21-152]|uniref:BrnT family toxin n=1 Tax=Psychromarinibacter sediminicola TaxID=3033385 RepID=A0AAE3NTA8_9RHOB|nr:BrnT family toxin [Psychromarinibacter sediminicola]MDF0601621.1 BrnT family toxin [Psychromarinibacter sediminicola]